MTTNTRPMDIKKDFQDLRSMSFIKNNQPEFFLDKDSEPETPLVALHMNHRLMIYLYKMLFQQNEELLKELSVLGLTMERLSFLRAHTKLLLHSNYGMLKPRSRLDLPSPEFMKKLNAEFKKHFPSK